MPEEQDQPQVNKSTRTYEEWKIALRKLIDKKMQQSLKNK